MNRDDLKKIIPALCMNLTMGVTLEGGKDQVVLIGGSTAAIEIVSVDFDDEGYKGSITYSDGTVITIIDADTDEDGKITRIYLDDRSGLEKYVDITYEGDYLRAVGGIPIEDIEALGLEDKLQDVSVIPGTQEQIITVDEEHDALGTVTVAGDKNLLKENIRKGVSLFGVDGNLNTEMQEKAVTPGRNNIRVIPDTGYAGLSRVTVEGSLNLLPKNIVEGVDIFGVVGTATGSGGGTGEGSDSDDKSWQRTKKVTDKAPVYVNVTVEIIREEG